MDDQDLTDEPVGNAPILQPVGIAPVLQDGDGSDPHGENAGAGNAPEDGGNGAGNGPEDGEDAGAGNAPEDGGNTGPDNAPDPDRRGAASSMSNVKLEDDPLYQMLRKIVHELLLEGIKFVKPEKGCPTYAFQSILARKNQGMLNQHLHNQNLIY